MENTNMNSKRQLFKETTFLILKKWSAFRISLDENPDVLTTYIKSGDEEETESDELEINIMLDTLVDDLFTEIEKEKVEKLAVDNLSDIFYCFFKEFFDIDLEDDSERFVSKNLIRLHNEIMENKMDYVERLRGLDKTIDYSNYSIRFPIVIDKNEVKINDSSDMDVDEDYIDIAKLNINSTNKNEPDEEGFVEVKKKKR